MSELLLPNIEVLTVGCDAVELRVDLLKEPLGDGTFAQIPSLSYVGEQIMLLRQRTELPIIYTTRCTQENGRFPMENPDLFYEYLYRAIQWGVEYMMSRYGFLKIYDESSTKIEVTVTSCRLFTTFR